MFIQESVLEYVVYKMSSIMFKELRSSLILAEHPQE